MFGAALLHLWCALLLALPGCSHEAAAAQEQAPLPTAENGVVRLPEKFLVNAGIETMVLAASEIAPVVHVNGVLEFDEQRIAAVGSRISGRVRKVEVIEGTRVKAGDVLASLDSAELGKAQADILAVQAKVQVASRDKQRKQTLLQEGITSQRAVDLASQESSVTAAELKAAKQRVQALGGRGGAAALGLMSLTSPIDGDVVKVYVFRGQAVEPSYTAFTVADRSSLWVRLAVFEGDIQYVHVGDAVELAPTSAPQTRLTGTVTYVSTSLDPVTRSAEVRVVVPNEDGALRVGQAIAAAIRPSAAVKQGLAIPREALVQVDGKPTVFVAVDETGFVPRTVEIGAESPATVEVTAGLTAGERVVTRGVFALKSELFR